MTGVGDQWAAASSYDAFMGRWSRRLAPDFVSWLQVPRGAHWLDVGCGTGALTNAICSHADPASVVGCDPSTPFVSFARERNTDPRQSFVVSGIGRLPRQPGGFGCVSSMFALNFFPQPEDAMHEMCSVAAPGGIVSACVWDYSDGMLFLRYFWNAALSQDSAAAALDEGSRFPLCRREPLITLFRGSGLGAVRCEPIEISTRFVDFDDYWRPFLGGTGPAPSYVAKLDSGHRDILERKLRDKLPVASDGSISLTARAWAICGVVN